MLHFIVLPTNILSISLAYLSIWRCHLPYILVFYASSVLIIIDIAWCRQGHIDSLFHPHTWVMRIYKEAIFTHNKAWNRVNHWRSCKIWPQTRADFNNQQQIIWESGLQYANHWGNMLCPHPAAIFNNMWWLAWWVHSAIVGWCQHGIEGKRIA